MPIDEIIPLKNPAALKYQDLQSEMSVMKRKLKTATLRKKK
jgi:hypothetical protein